MDEPRTARLTALAKRLVPWVSLAIGIASALLMDRTPARGAAVAAVAGVTWVVLIVVIWLGRLRHTGDPAHPRARVLLGAHWTSLMFTQSSVHLQLYFVLPYYYLAWAGTLGHTVFLFVLGVAALVSLWDPVTEWMLTKSRVGLLLPGFSTFVALAAVLPALGVRNGLSIWLAAAGSGLALPVIIVADRMHGRRSAFAAAVAIALAIPAALAVGAVRCVPAAPMQLISVEIGTRQRGRSVADPTEHFDARPGRMMCASAIYAPHGVADAMLHVWRHDGVVVDRIPLEIEGGRDSGFRTWSIKRNFGDDPNGTWSCAIETAAGQFLGQTTVTIGPR